MSMAFWGSEVKPGEPYVHQHDDERGRLHLSQATIRVAGSSNKRTVLQCSVGNNTPTYLCSLLPEKIETCPLNLEFEEDEDVKFSVEGPHSVHLSGFFYGPEEEHDNCCNEYDSDSEEDVMMSGSEDEYDSMEYDSEDDGEDVVYSDDELGLYPSKVPNSGVRIEEIEEEKPVNESDMSKQAKKKKRSKSGTSNENANRQIVAKAGNGVLVLESEDEDGFPTSSRNKKSDALGSKTEEADKETSGLKNQENKQTNTSGKKLKRKIDAVSQDGEPTRDNDKPQDSSAVSDTTTPVSEVKQKKKNKKKKVEKEETVQDSATPNSKATGESPVAEKDLKQTADKKKEKKKESKQQESAVTPKTQGKVADKKESTAEKKEKRDDKSMQVRTFPNGLKIEELVMGKPDGKRASPGKKVSVRYIGKLQKNDKIFDSNVAGPPFKFRLGIGQVIKGWDVGVNGMRVGDKRRLTIPPAMGYGAKGAKPDIPPNAWLVFDVDLVDVN